MQSEILSLIFQICYKMTENKKVLSDEEVKAVAKYANACEDFERVANELKDALTAFMLNEVVAHNDRAMVKVNRFRLWVNKFQLNHELDTED